MQNFPISTHEKRKKELLTLPQEQLTLLVTIALNKNDGDSHDLLTILRRASERSPGLGQWTLGNIKRIERKLEASAFAYRTYGGLNIAKAWSDTVIFAADALRPEYLKAIIQSINLLHRYPSSGEASYRFSPRYDDLRQRIVHKILLNEPEEFRRLYQSLGNQNSWNMMARSSSVNAIKRLLTTTDWTFWKTRDSYFQWTALAEYQHNYLQWTTDTPQELERMLIPLMQSPEAEDYLEDIRVICLLGLDYYRHRAELFVDLDPGLAAVCHLARGDREAAAAAFAQLPPHDPEIPADLVDVIRSAFEYGRGNWDKTRLSQEVGTFLKSHYPNMINGFLAYAYQEFEDPDVDPEQMLEDQFAGGNLHPTDWLVLLWCARWMGIKLRQKSLYLLFDNLMEGYYTFIPWVENEIVYALKKLFPSREIALDVELKRARTQVQSEDAFLHLLPERPNWSYALRHLQRITAKESKEATKSAQNRTIWIVDFDEETAYCKEQKSGKRGWTKGRKLKWGELIQARHPKAFHPADHKAIRAITTRNNRPVYSGSYYSEEALSVDFGQLLYEITDHPRVYLGESKRIPIELIRAEPELRVTESQEGGIHLSFIPDVEAKGYVWEKETPTRYRVYHLSEEQAAMAWAISGGVDLPDEQRGTVETLVEELRPSVNIQSAFDLIDEDLEIVHGSALPCFHLLPYGEGYKIELYVKSLPEEPFYFKPGAGMPRSIIVLEDGRRILERPLKLEQEEAAAAINACPTLAATPQTAYEWTVEDTTSALSILLELRALLAQQLVSIEHPKGEKFKIVGQAGSDELAVRVGKNRDWFEVNGKLTVDEKKVLDLEQLFEHLRANKDNPFIELGEGEFLAITEELRDRILEMEGLLHQKGKKLQLPTLAAGAFAEIADDLQDLEFDDAWQESLDRIAKAEKIRPRVPKTFRAELRDYQKEGFRWLMRLAAWGVGGCLADDMGLGKTVQALAMLSARADKGPSLVIAPASVTRNWLRETERFTPDLIPVLVASSTGTALLPQLGTGDLALVSYGLLPFIGDELAEIEWANIILDEAQAVKNAATKRAKAVQNLQGDFKLATTGTPIENHLGELWSLFRFLNPGLLGGKTAFNEKYNRPIARDGDEDRRNALKNLVKPFILRRRKDEVLTELPPKTEIVLNVNLSEEEKALYEAMRRQAIKEIAAADEQQKRFTVLSQLTKLRQAACHPRLVRPQSKVGSAKLELVGETLLEILESGHKALIFSQFVKHLKIVENWIKGQGIAYQYLDGSTPGKKREERVNAFQAGEGDVFLISLKAGGTGLNLTAADYVLHLDPWWNPAAEDQASDRAHRIGQQRPVTVYRFVSEGTIEEQIIALHAEKRDLADQILAGTGKAGKLGVDEILSLISSR